MLLNLLWLNISHFWCLNFQQNCIHLSCSKKCRNLQVYCWTNPVLEKIPIIKPVQMWDVMYHGRFWPWSWVVVCFTECDTTCQSCMDLWACLSHRDEVEFLTHRYHQLWKVRKKWNFSTYNWTFNAKRWTFSTLNWTFSAKRWIFNSFKEPSVMNNGNPFIVLPDCSPFHCLFELTSWESMVPERSVCSPKPFCHLKETKKLRLKQHSITLVVYAQVSQE